MIESNDEYIKTLIKLNEIFDSDQEDYINSLVDLLEEYEDKYFKIGGMDEKETEENVCKR